MKNAAFPLITFVLALLSSPLIYIGLLNIQIAIQKIRIVILLRVRNLCLKKGKNVMNKAIPLHKEHWDDKAVQMPTPHKFMGEAGDDRIENEGKNGQLDRTNE